MNCTNTFPKNCLTGFFTLLLFAFSFPLLANTEPEKPTSIVAVCNANVNVSLDLNGEALILPEYLDEGSFDTEGPISSMSVSPNFFDCADVNQTFVVTLTISGPSGTNTCWSQVTIEDKLPPVAACQSEVFINLGPGGSVNLDAEYVNAFSWDNCTESLTFSLSQSVFNCSDVGSSVIVMTATDGGGNSNTCYSIIHVEDNQPPAAVCESDVNVSLPPSGVATVPGDIVGSGSVDNCASSLSYSLSQSEFTCADLGSTVVTLTVTDGGGNANQCLSTIHVSDLLPPTAVCVAGINVTVGPTGSYTVFPIDLDGGSTDNCGIASHQIVSGQTTYTCADAGEVFNLLLRVTDASGNSSECFCQVFVGNGGSPDDDCDGVGNACDLCPGGNDTVDNNGDGQPDCAFPPSFAQIIPAWKCGSNKVYICKGNKTKCINYNALAAQMAGGAKLGPCGNASCGGGGAMASNGDLSANQLTPEFAFESAGASLTLIRRDNRLQIALEDMNSEGKLLLCDQLGRVLRTETIPAFSTEAVLDLATLKEGVYMLHLSGNGLLLTEKFVLVR